MLRSFALRVVWLLVGIVGCSACGATVSAEQQAVLDREEANEERQEAIAEMTSAGLTEDQAGCTFDFVEREFGTDFATDFDLENQSAEDTEAILAIVAECLVVDASVDSSASGEAADSAAGECELDIDGAPGFGEHALSAGFVPELYEVDVVGGGCFDAVTVAGPECPGLIAPQPSLRLSFDGGPPAMLRFYFVADDGHAATLIVNDPNVDWSCSDDFADGPGPSVEIMEPPNGRYDVWVGTKDPDVTPTGTLYITEQTGPRN